MVITVAGVMGLRVFSFVVNAMLDSGAASQK
jgi:hypothetical protein